jgi:hypothetical protein
VTTPPSSTSARATRTSAPRSPAQPTDKNLGLKYFLNGALVSNIVLDTTQIATDTIAYVATDPTGLTATSTRTVIIEGAAPPSPQPASAAASSTPAAFASSTAAVASSTAP